MNKHIFFVITIALFVFNNFSFSKNRSTHNTLNIAILGDSNTWIGGDDCDRIYGWNMWFCREFSPRTCHSYARSGATWTHTFNTVSDITGYYETINDNNVIYNQALRLYDEVKKGTQPTPDIIIIAAGTNDVWFLDKRPLVFDKTAKEVFSNTNWNFKNIPINSIFTLAEAIRYVCESLNEVFPTTRLILLTPLQSTNVSISDIEKIGDLIESVGQYMQIDVIRQDKYCVIRAKDEAKKYVFTTDGTHTSEEGARKNGEILAYMIGDLLQ